VRVRGDVGGRAEKRGACVEGTGRNPGKVRRSMSRHPLAGGNPVPEEAQLMERVVERSNMQAALKRVKQNKGAPGVDGMSVDELGGFLRTHWPKIRERLCEGTYEPMPVKRVQIPKANGGKRPWKRFKMLTKQGLSEERAARSAFNQRGPWFNAGASHMNQAFPKRYFDQFGLISTLDTLRRLG
jgi:hypothetical protein